MTIDKCANTSSQADVPDTPQFRPEWHFAPQRNWMNDPNGLVYFEGEYHLFYQYNPCGKEWGHMNWGHAVSTDLVHWTELPVAIPEGEQMIFSGGAVVDWDNSSGLGDGVAPPIVAIYTAHHSATAIQSQHVAYSHDKGRTWQSYSNNPVIDLGLEHFRDPKVFRHAASGAWIMAVALPRDHKVQFYRSANLLEWTLVGDFGPAGATGGQWECPDLIEIGIEGTGGEPATRWVLKVDIDKNLLDGGSGAQYFVGTFDGFSFAVDPTEAPADGEILDFGPDFYAAVTWSDLPPGHERPVLIGWLSNHQSGHSYPTHPWRGVQSVPRVLTLFFDNGRLKLKQAPVAEYLLEAGRTGRFQQVVAKSPGRITVAENQGCVAIDCDNGTWRPGRVRFLDGDTELAALTIGEDHVAFARYATEAIHIDDYAREVLVGARQAKARTVLILLDKCTVEIFVDDGELVFSCCLFPVADLSIEWS